MVSRLPTPGGDPGSWGTVLNDFLLNVHNTDGTLKDGLVSNAKLDSSLQTSLASAASKYSKPGSGIPASDLNLADVSVGLLAQPGVVALTDAATIATNVALGKLFRVTVSANRTLGAPSNPIDGQRAMWEVSASGSDRILTLATGSAGAFKFGSDIGAVPAIVAGTTTFIGAVYRSASQRWHVLAVSSGH